MSATFLEDLQRRLAPYGLDPEATKWVLKALHPTSPHDCPGVPDSSYVKSVRSETRGQVTIAAPVYTTSTWDLVVYRWPVDCSPVIAYSRPSGGSDLTRTVLNCYSLVSDSANPLGSVNTLDRAYSYPAPNLVVEDRRTDWRTMYSSLTCYMTASALNDGGTVYAGQFAGDPLVRICGTVLQPPPTPGTALYPVYNILRFPYVPGDPDSLARVNPRYYTAPARDGVYIPSRFYGPILPMRPRQRELFAHNPSNGTLYFRSEAPPPAGGMQPNPTGSLMNWSPEPMDQPFDVPGPPQVDTSGWSAFYDNSAPAVVFYQGLQPQATITIRYVMGSEIVVDPESPVAQFARVPPRYDPRAMEVYYRLVQEMPDVYPASWNSLGILGTAIGALASRLWPAIKAAVPHLAQAARAGGSAFVSGTQPSMGESQRVVTIRPARSASVGSRVSVKSKSKKTKKRR